MLFLVNGGFLHGNFVNGTLNGAGFLRLSNDEVYDGHWRNGFIHGVCYNYYMDEEVWLQSEYCDG
jgi:hypothetical protein